jgi:hypothetical protein
MCVRLTDEEVRGVINLLLLEEGSEAEPYAEAVSKALVAYS